jgi:hypothetical protein
MPHVPSERLRPTERELLDLAHKWHNNTRSAALSNSGRSRRRRTEKAEREIANRRAGADVPDRFEHLVAALRRQIEEAPKP